MEQEIKIPNPQLNLVRYDKSSHSKWTWSAEDDAILEDLFVKQTYSVSEISRLMGDRVSGTVIGKRLVELGLNLRQFEIITEEMKQEIMSQYPIVPDVDIFGERIGIRRERLKTFVRSLGLYRLDPHERAKCQSITPEDMEAIVKKREQKKKERAKKAKDESLSPSRPIDFFFDVEIENGGWEWYGCISGSISGRWRKPESNLTDNELEQKYNEYAKMLKGLVPYAKTMFPWLKYMNWRICKTETTDDGTEKVIINTLKPDIKATAQELKAMMAKKRQELRQKEVEKYAQREEIRKRNKAEKEGE